MKSILLALSVMRSAWTWIQEIRDNAYERLSVQAAQRDRLAVERALAAMKEGRVSGVPWRSLRVLCRWLARLGLLKKFGAYGQAFLKSQKLWEDDPVLFEYQEGKQ